jgi:hypothetical protein
MAVSLQGDGAVTPTSGRRLAQVIDIEEEEGGFAVRPRKRLLLPFIALLGATVAVLPALAASSEAKLEVNENCNYAAWPCWTSSAGAKPPPATVTTIAQGGVITFVDETGVAANLAWAGAAPTCSAAVPVSPTPAKTGWEGTCTFAAPGRYMLESATLYASYRNYEIVVQAPGTTGTSTGGSTTIGSTTPGSGSGSGSGSSSGSGVSTQTGESTGAGTPLGSLLAGSESSAVTVGATRHGASVHGSVDVAQGGAGGRLEVELLASRASLASAGHSAAQVQVGRAVRVSLRAGTVTFTVALDARARHALRVRGRLALSVEIVLAPAHGAAATITRHIVLRG